MIKKTMATIGIIVLVLIVSACDHNAIGDRLNGTWVAESGVRFTFDNTNFTREPLFGAVETGTYTANDGFITLSHYGAFVDISLKYVLQFPYLTIDEIRYTSASSIRPPSPPSIDGFWALPPRLFVSSGFNIVFRNGENKGDGIEGEYNMIATFKGIYNTRHDLISNTNTLVMTPTHVHGSYFKDFLDSLSVSFFILFDVPESPTFTLEDQGEVWGMIPWWYTPDEALKYFKDAENRAETLAVRSELVHIRNAFFRYFEPRNYQFSLEFTTIFPDDLDLNLFVTSGARNQLTLIDDLNNYGSTSVFYRLKLGVDTISQD